MIFYKFVSENSSHFEDLLLECAFFKKYYFSPSFKLNDPFEYFKNISHADPRIQQELLMHAIDFMLSDQFLLPEVAKACRRMLCTGMKCEEEKIKEILHKRVNQKKEYRLIDQQHHYEYMMRGVGYFCVSSTIKSQLMWTHYANSFSGICLELELSELDDSKISHFLERVLYDDQRENFTYSEVIHAYFNRFRGPKFRRDFTKSTNRDYFSEFCAKKSSDWSYEKEYRFISYDIHKQQYQEIPELNLKSVVFGPRSTIVTIHRVKEVLGTNVSYKRAKLAPNSYTLEIHQE